MIDEVVGIRVELETSSLIDRKLLLHGQIPVLESRLINGVTDALLKIEGARRRRRKDRRTIRIGCGEVLSLIAGISGKPLKDSGGSIHYIELPFGTTSEATSLTDTCLVVTCSDSAGRACLELSISAQLPTAQQFAGDHVLVGEEWQSVEIVDDRIVPGIVLRRTPEIAGVIAIRNDVSVVRAVIHALGVGITKANHETAREPPVP